MLAHLGVEDVDNDIVEIDHHPATDRKPMMMFRPHPRIPATPRDFVGNRPEMRFGITGADEEVIGDSRGLADVEDDHVASLFIKGGLTAKFG